MDKSDLPTGYRVTFRKQVQVNIEKVRGENTQVLRKYG